MFGHGRDLNPVAVLISRSVGRDVGLGRRVGPGTDEFRFRADDPSDVRDPDRNRAGDEVKRRKAKENPAQQGRVGRRPIPLDASLDAALQLAYPYRKTCSSSVSLFTSPTGGDTSRLSREAGRPGSQLA